MIVGRHEGYFDEDQITDGHVIRCVKNTVIAENTTDHVFRQCFEARFRTTAYGKILSAVDSSKAIATFLSDQALDIVFPTQPAILESV